MEAYRAAYWTNGHGAVIVLTLPEHAKLSEEEILAEALQEAERMGLDLSIGKVVIGEEWAK